MSQIILDTPTHQIRTADGATIGQGSIRKITTQAFYRRLTVTERNALRTGTTDEIADMRDDLQRSPFLDLDGAIEAQLLSVGVNQTRVDQLLVDGTQAETETG